MKEYKYSLFAIINYIPVLLFEGVLIYLSTLLIDFKWIILSFTVFIIVLSIYYFVRQLSVKHSLNSELIGVKFNEKYSIEISYCDIRDITINKRNIEISFRLKKKMKIHFINKYLSDYEEFKKTFLELIKTSKYYSDINLIE